MSNKLQPLTTVIANGGFHRKKLSFLFNYLKITKWYRMYTKSNMKLVPQLQEGITKAMWVNYNDISDKMINTYGSIKDVLRHV